MLNRFLRFMVFATLMLIVAGSLVTSQDYGLAVPDWPKSYGMWFPPMIGGVLYEHGHRMIAGLVGILTVIMTIWLWMKESRKWVRVLGTIALFSVIAQAVLGGITVLYFLPTWVSTFHATLAQTFFCMIVSLSIFTSSWWKEPLAKSDHSENPTMRFAATTALIFLQLIVGSWMRHSHAALAIPDFPLAFGKIIPPITSPEIGIHFAHRLGALAILLFVTWNLIYVVRTHKTQSKILRPSVILMLLVIAQITLGAFTIWTKTAVPIATLHVITGALILATSLTLTLRAHKIFRRPEVETSPAWNTAVRTI